MKILLDENIDVRLKSLFPVAEHEVYSVVDMGWSGMKNDDLLELLAENNFDCWIIVDKAILYRRNLTELPCMVTVLDADRNTRKQLTPLISRIFIIPEPGNDRDDVIIPE